MTAKLIVPALALAAAAFLAAMPAAAATPPAGSYRESCNNVRAARNVLRARCERNNGRLVRTQLDAYSTCVGDIANYDGRLICLRRDEVPAGSWSNECRNPRLIAPGTFAADCPHPRGGRVTLQIALDQCPAGLAVASRRFVCEKLRGDIFLYERNNYRGRVFATSANVPVLPRTFNDAASSVRIADGRWQVCAEPNYRGRCVFLRGDTPELLTVGLNRKISSLRRVPEPQYPAGSWRDSCRSPNFVGALFTASCSDQRGRYRSSTIDLRDCRNQRVANDDGRLVCEEGGGAAAPGDRDSEADSLPPGSYRDSCRYAKFDGRTLRAQCRDGARNWRNTELDTRDCDRNKEIVNDDGELGCRLRGRGDTGADEGPGSAGPPRGSYEQSCREIQFDGRYLTARCPDTRGKLRNARLDMRECDPGDEVVNDDGDLVCRSEGPVMPVPRSGPAGSPTPGPSPNPAAPASAGPPPPPPPAPPPLAAASPPAAHGPPPSSGSVAPGSGPSGGGNPAADKSPPPAEGATVAGDAGSGGPSGLVLFERTNFEGRSQTFMADISDLTPGGWNDLAESLKIARGRWEVCAEANYAGRCETFNADQATLPPDLSGKISSIRRVRRERPEGAPTP